MDITQFLEIEKTYQMNTMSVEGVRYWTYNRFKIWNYYICSEALSLQASNGKNTITINKFFSLALHCFLGKNKLKQHEMLVLNHNRRILINGQYECIYTDSLFSEGCDALFYEAPFQYAHLKPTASKLICYADSVLVGANLWLKVYKTICKRRYKKLCCEISNQISTPINEIKNYYAWTKDLNSIVNELADSIIKTKYEKKRYRKVLDKVKPKLIVEVVHYGHIQMIFNELAKEMDIPTVELQHGTMHKDHAAYQYSKGEVIPQFPDNLFVFSEYWKKCINIPIKSNDIIATGYPYFEDKIKKYANYKRIDSRKTLIFISQGTISKYLADFASCISQILNSCEYRVVYKLHPSEYESWKKELPDLLDSCVEVIDDRHTDLYELFAQADIQIGVYSTALYEGLGFGLKTYIYKVGHYDTMLPLIEAGYAELVSSPTECVQKIENNISSNLDGSCFWKLNAINNIEKEIKRILDTKRGKI